MIGAIDFTYSNGNASNPTSLHYVGNPKNQYLNCLTAVTSILDQYDSDGKYPFYGFGAIPTFMGATEVSDCFPLNGNINDPHITGIDGVVAAYCEKVGWVKMMGPTKFAPIIRQCRKYLEECQDPKMYFVMLILTDGEIHDMKETIDEIADISIKKLPVSFVIVGVGNEDFSNMVRLDGDDVALRVGANDIVQFVKYEEVIARSEPGMADQNLASLVLEEVPNQLVKSFTQRNIYP